MRPQPTPSFDRVLTTLGHHEPDRVPVAEMSVDPEVKEAFLGRPVLTLEDDIEFWRSAGYDFIAIDTDLYSTLQIQERITNPHADTANAYTHHRPQRNWVASAADAIRTRQDIEAFPWPCANNFDLSVYPELQRRLPAGMGVITTIGHIFTTAWQLMGFERFCTSLLDDPELVEDIFVRYGEETLALLEAVLAYDCVSAVCFQDDIAFTSGPLVSPKLLRRVFFPWLSRVAEICHAHGRPLFYHSDGKMDVLIPEVIAAGVDALHPIEPKCMDITAVKRLYGNQLALVGNLDLGYTLTRGTPDEVRDAVRDLIAAAAPGGGFLLGSANSITNYVPLENFKALLAATEEFGTYPIKVG